MQYNFTVKLNPLWTWTRNWENSLSVKRVRDLQKPAIGKMESLSSAAELTGMNSEIAEFPLSITQHSEGISAFMRKEIT